MDTSSTFCPTEEEQETVQSESLLLLVSDSWMFDIHGAAEMLKEGQCQT